MNLLLHVYGMKISHKIQQKVSVNIEDIKEKYQYDIEKM